MLDPVLTVGRLLMIAFVPTMLLLPLVIALAAPNRAATAAAGLVKSQVPSRQTVMVAADAPDSKAARPPKARAATAIVRRALVSAKRCMGSLSLPGAGRDADPSEGISDIRESPRPVERGRGAANAPPGHGGISRRLPVDDARPARPGGSRGPDRQRMNRCRFAGRDRSHPPSVDVSASSASSGSLSTTSLILARQPCQPAATSAGE